MRITIHPLNKDENPVNILSVDEIIIFKDNNFIGSIPIDPNGMGNTNDIIPTLAFHNVKHHDYENCCADKIIYAIHI